MSDGNVWQGYVRHHVHPDVQRPPREAQEEEEVLDQDLVMLHSLFMHSTLTHLLFIGQEAEESRRRTHPL